MKFLKQTAVLAFIFCAGPLFALNITGFEMQDGTGYFDFGYFAVQNTEIRHGRLLMPLEKDEHRNIRVLSGELLRQMEKCFDSCEFTAAAKPGYKILTYRVHGGLAIIDVDFDGELIVTFLMSRTAKNGRESRRVMKPGDFIFKNSAFEAELKEYLKKEIKFDESGK